MNESERQKAAREAAGNSGLYDAREHMLISAPPSMALATEKAFFSVMSVRDAVISNSHLDSPAFLKAKQDFDQAIWDFRQAAREDIGNVGLDLGKIIQVEASRPNPE
jgi:hypothetical protein